MTPTPPSTTSSSSGQSPDAQYRVVRKRNRIPLSCAPCRHRKLKCNRAHPCDNCTKRGDTSSCTYASPGNRKKNQTSPGSTNSPDDMQNRIDRLEGLVLSLMTNGAQSAGPAAAAAALASAGPGIANGSISGSSADAPLDVEGSDLIKEEPDGTGDDSEIENVTKSIGIMKVDNGRNIFASEAHWYAILGEISEVKQYFAQHNQQYQEQMARVKAMHPDDESPGVSYLFRANKPADRSELVRAFPPKSTADLLVTRYFNTYDPALHIIHGPTFQKQYDQHWSNPDETPVIWLGLAFAMMTMALQSYSRANDEPPEYRGKSWEISGEYRRLTAQCIILADITNPIQHMLETLMLHIHAEYARSRDSETGIMISMSIIVRLAMRQGLHRDPGPYSIITPFQGEIRRRVWSCIRTADLLFSAQAGLPPVSRTLDTNTELPRNVYDDELYEDMKVLPASRPASEATPASYMIEKARIVSMLGEIVEKTSALHCGQYEEIMNLDRRLSELQATLPPHLRMRPLDESLRDSASLIMQRYTLDLLILKSKCLLHRKFLSASRTNARYAYSRRAGIDASMTMLRHQLTLHREALPGGRLRSVKWFIFSLTTSDFLLAAMTVCLDLHHTAEAERQGRRTSNELYDFTRERREDMIATLESVVTIWEGLADRSMEAYKAHTTLQVMLSKIRIHYSTQQSFSPAAQAYPATAMQDDTDVGPEHSAAMTLGMLSTGALTPGASNMFDPGRYPSFDPSQQGSTGLTPNYSGTADSGPVNAPSPFTNMFGGGAMGLQGLDMPSTDIDWNAWDSYVGGASIDNPNQGWTMNMDLPSNGMVDGSLDGSQLSSTQPQSQQQGQATNGFGSNSGGVFMGVSTPEMKF